jgi:hypothetical protein
MYPMSEKLQKGQENANKLLLFFYVCLLIPGWSYEQKDNMAPVNSNGWHPSLVTTVTSSVFYCTYSFTKNLHFPVMATENASHHLLQQ